MYRVLVKEQEGKNLDGHKFLSYIERKNLNVSMNELEYNKGKIKIFQGTKSECNKIKKELDKDKAHFTALGDELQYLDYFVEKYDHPTDVEKLTNYINKNRLKEKIQTLELLKSYNINKGADVRFEFYRTNRELDSELESVLNLKGDALHNKLYELRVLVEKVFHDNIPRDINEELTKLKEELQNLK